MLSSIKIEYIVEIYRDNQATKVERDVEIGESMFSKDKKYREYENKTIKKSLKIVK